MLLIDRWLTTLGERCSPICCLTGSKLEEGDERGSRRAGLSVIVRSTLSFIWCNGPSVSGELLLGDLSAAVDVALRLCGAGVDGTGDLIRSMSCGLAARRNGGDEVAGCGEFSRSMGFGLAARRNGGVGVPSAGDLVRSMCFRLSARRKDFVPRSGAPTSVMARPFL
jgi:hypothetical protein